MLAQYLIINNIQNVAIYKEDGRWQVYIGRFKSGEEQGIKEGEPFKTKREALGFAERCRELIDSVR